MKYNALYHDRQKKIAIYIFVVTSLRQNCSLVIDTNKRRGVVVDPGGDPDRIFQNIKDLDVEVTHILLTHGHIDHIAGAGALSRMLGVPVFGPHVEDKFFIDSVIETSVIYGWDKAENFSPEYLNDGQTTPIGNYDFQVLHCPGHSPGHIVFLNKDLSLAFVGDVLFKGSIGRTDLPKSSHQDLIRSITKKLWAFGDIDFISGHGDRSDFLNERRNNKYVSDALIGSK